MTFLGLFIVVAATLSSTTSCCSATAADADNDIAAAAATTANNLFSSKANLLVDDFLANISQKLDEKFEPILLPEKSHSFEKKILFVTVKGESQLYDGWLAGFSTLHRNGDASSTSTPGTRILKAPLGVSNLAGHYRGKVTFMNLGPKIEVNIRLAQLAFEVYLMQLDGESTARLGSLKIVREGGLDLKIEGLGILDWVLTPLNTFLVKALKGFIWHFLETHVKSWLAQQIQTAKISLK